MLDLGRSRNRTGELRLGRSRSKTWKLNLGRSYTAGKHRHCTPQKVAQKIGFPGRYQRRTPSVGRKLRKRKGTEDRGVITNWIKVTRGVLQG